MILAMLLIGQKLVLPLFIGIYLVRWGRYDWKLASGYAIGGWLLLAGFYDKIMNLQRYPAWLYYWLPELLPPWLPAWLFV